MLSDYTIQFVEQICHIHVLSLLNRSTQANLSNISQCNQLWCFCRIHILKLTLRLKGPNSNEGHNGTSRLRYVWVWEKRSRGLGWTRSERDHPSDQIRPNCCGFVCTTRLSIPRCQSNTHPNPEPVNPTLISWHGNLSRNAHNQSQRAQIPTQYICHPDICVRFLKYFTSLNIVNIWRSLDISAILVSSNFAKFSHTCFADHLYPTFFKKVNCT